MGSEASGDVKDKLQALFSPKELEKLVKTREHENKIRECLTPIYEAIKIETARHKDAMFKLEHSIALIQQECRHDWGKDQRMGERDPDVEYGMAGGPTYTMYVCNVCRKETIYEPD